MQEADQLWVSFVIRSRQLAKSCIIAEEKGSIGPISIPIGISHGLSIQCQDKVRSNNLKSRLLFLVQFGSDPPFNDAPGRTVSGGGTFC